MTSQAPTARRLVSQAHLALVFLTRLPLPPLGALPPGGVAQAMAWFPVVGALVGAGAGGVYALASLGLAPLPAAVLAVAVAVLATGGLHEDGLADVADGFGCGGAKDRVLEILRDSRIGSYGALALVLALTLRIATLATLGAAAGWAAMVAAAALGRAVMPAMMAWNHPARADGLAVAAGRPDRETAALAAVVGLAAALAVLPPGRAAAAAVAAALAAGAVAALANRKIGGYTGDVLGAGEQAAELAALLAVAALP